MATYLVVPDDYAGWNPTGRNFAFAGIAAGSIGLLSWLSLHGDLGSFEPHAIADQIFLSGLVWLGGAGFCLMAIVAVGSILLTLKSRGTVNVTDEGVSRSIGSRTDSLAWSDIQGFCPGAYGGVTLVSAPGKPDLIIPRFIDDYRACIAEIKDHSINAVPASLLRRKQKTTWTSVARSFLFLYCYILATNTHESHRVRIVSFCAAIAFIAWAAQAEWTTPGRVVPRWISSVIVLAIILYALWRMAISW